MSAETPQPRSHTDNLKIFPDVQRGESDILEKEYVHSTSPNLIKPIKIILPKYYGEFSLHLVELPVKNGISLLGEWKDFTAPKSSLVQTHRETDELGSANGSCSRKAQHSQSEFWRQEGQRPCVIKTCILKGKCIGWDAQGWRLKRLRKKRRDRRVRQEPR